MTTWWWIRHGPTHSKALVGLTDLPADLTDRVALEKLSAYLPRDAVVISSDLRRAVDTADAIQGNRARLDHTPRLRELHFGEWENLTYDEISARDPCMAREYVDRPGEITPPGGEPWAEARERVDRIVDELSESHAGRHIVAVAHFGVILTQIQRVMNLENAKILDRKIDNLSVTRISLKGGVWRMHEMSHRPLA